MPGLFRVRLCGALLGIAATMGACTGDDSAAREARGSTRETDGSTGAAAERSVDSAAPSPVSDPSIDALAAADLVRQYYAAISAGRFAEAHAHWSGGGAASGQTLDGFAAGFAETGSVSVEIGTPGRVEGAAGSRYITIPVVVRAVTTSGEPQRFEGTYTLRRSVVDGASAEQREWRIAAAEMERGW